MSSACRACPGATTWRIATGSVTAKTCWNIVRACFAGTSPEDRRVRRQFWSLVADLVADRYFGALERWCEGHRVASSGHSLWEEAVLHHVPLEGNGLKVLGRMHIPGLDMLNSDPEAVIHSGWLTAALPASAARLGGRRRVMTEVSDFSQKMGGQGPVGLAEMQATAAWQAAWDVTDFTLYYGMGDRSADDYRAYCDFVGRLNAVLKEATPHPGGAAVLPHLRPVGRVPAGRRALETGFAVTCSSAAGRIDPATGADAAAQPSPIHADRS